MTNEKTLNTRIKLKYDRYDVWSTKNPVLLQGEVAIAYIPSAEPNHNVNIGEGSVSGTTPPQVLIKVGDGEHNYNDLKYVSALAADVLAACKSEAGLTAFVNNVITAANLASAETVNTLSGALETLTGRVGDAETDITNIKADIVTIKGDENTEGSFAKAIKDAIDALDLANTYAAKEHKHVVADITDFETKVASYDYATKAEAKGYADAKDEAIAAAQSKADQGVSDAAAVAGNLATHIEGYNATVATLETKEDAAQKLVDAKKYTDDQIAAIPEQTDYSVTITEDTTDSTIAKRYIFTQLGAEIGRIDLAKELVVTEGSVEEVTEADVPYAGAVVGDKYIKLVIANQTEPIYVPAKDLVDIYTAKDGATEVQVAISNTNEISATLVNGGVTEEKLAEGVKTKLNKTWEEVGVAKDLVDALAETHATDKAALEKAIQDSEQYVLENAGEWVSDLANGQVKTNTDAIAAINDTETGILAQASEDASSKAAVVLAEAQKYADEVASNVHTTLDTAVQTVSTPTTTDDKGNTIPNGLKAEKVGTDVAISIDDSVVFIFDCGTADIQ